jgi:peptidoglycan/LPS O-acetylase OafA/YrhL
MRTEIKPLTGVRGVAAMIIIIYHYGRPYQSMGVDTGFHIRQGYIAVDSFYILSGFVLALTYGAWFSKQFDLARFGGFMLRRIARVYPAYIVIMTVDFLRSAINVSGNGALNHYKTYDYTLNILMMTGLGLNVYPIIADAWSVSAELAAYIFFPFLVFFAVFCRPATGLLVFCFAVAGIVLVTRFGSGFEGPLDVMNPATAYPMLRCVSDFTMGLVLFRVSLIPALRSMMASEIPCVLAIIALVASWMAHAPDLMIFAGLLPLILALSFNGAIANRLFGNRAVHYLGEISYSLYLIHPTFISATVAFARIAQDRFGIYGLYPIFAAIAWTVSIKLAGLSERWIETPGRRWVMASASRFAAPKIA